MKETYNILHSIFYLTQGKKLPLPFICGWSFDSHSNVIVKKVYNFSPAY